MSRFKNVSVCMCVYVCVRVFVCAPWSKNDVVVTRNP